MKQSPMGVDLSTPIAPGAATIASPPHSRGSAFMSSRLSLLVDLASLLGREVDFDALLSTACERLAVALSAERATIWLVDAERGDLFARARVLPEGGELRQPIERGISGHVARTGEVVRIADVAKDSRFDRSIDKVTGYTTRSMLVAPIREDGRAPIRGVVQILNRVGQDARHVSALGGAFDSDDEKYLVALGTQLARALSLTTLRAADASGPGVTLRGPFNRIVGTSSELTRVYERVALAAQTDATVLLRGATGTGKGLFARAIHVNSKRQAGPFVTVDCTTLPSQLVESELFGHERGAFTGADKRVLGKVEHAHGGTLFLDEIGDLPLDVQGKFLRLLQERAFERVGGRSTVEADVRIVCATHRDLEEGVASGKFREDLYYRLRVVEIELPSLAARGGDEVEALARHFADMYSQKYDRPRSRFEDDALARLRAHDWPGNVRELEHWIESAIVLAPNGVISRGVLPEPRVKKGGKGTSTSEIVEVPAGLSLDDASRAYAETVVRACAGNKALAAKKLGIGRNTLARLLKRGDMD